MAGALYLSGCRDNPARNNELALKLHTSKRGATVITVIPGDGIGPECMAATLSVIEASGARLEWETHLAGRQVFEKGINSGVAPETIESIKKTRIVLKAPLETPVGLDPKGIKNFKSANVTLRKLFETYGNIRPARELPGVPSPYKGRGIDILIVRENVEDLYAGIEYMQTPGVAQGIKLITRKGCEKIIRLAFELARAEGRQKIHCATKANIMKFTEGMLKRVFEEIAPEYPEIKTEHIIVDNCAHMLVKKPEMFDVIVSTNMNGDILSDLTSGLVGGLGFAPSANLGAEIAIFEAVHGTAPDIAGQDKANPTAMILSAVMMLRHIGQFEASEKIEHAILLTLEEGKHLTGDIAPSGAKAASTSEFTQAVIANLGKRASALAPREYKPLKMPVVSASPAMVVASQRRTIGVDLFVESDQDAKSIGDRTLALTADCTLKLKVISNRGAQVYPLTAGYTDCVDQWRLRFIGRDNGQDVTDTEIMDLVKKISGEYHWINIEKLNEFDGAPGYTKSQGEE